MDFTIIITDKKPTERKVTISIGALARETGYDKSHISRIFSGKTFPSLKCADKIAVALGITVDELSAVLTKRNRTGKYKQNRPVRAIYAKVKAV